MIRRQHVVPDFFKEAEAMREALDSRLTNIYTRSMDWGYFCDPKMYTYLRTEPQRVLPKALVDSFVQCLRNWCIENLGLVPMGVPFLHLMVNGCKLGLHSDFHNGAWGYVYSLTRWSNRKFRGGETLLLRDGVPSYKKHHVHGEVLYELFPAHFNQLLVFDDRIVHATPTIEGSMDPVEGRIALVGHIRATAPKVSGSIPQAEGRRVVREVLPKLRDQLRGYRDIQGTITHNIIIGPNGAVESVRTLTDNIVTPSTGYDHSEAVVSAKSLIQQTLTGLRFPTAAGKSSMIVPLLIPIPDLRPIDIVIPRNPSRDIVCNWTAADLVTLEELELKGEWDGDMFVAREPVPGTIHIGPHQIAVSFDPPMWVPSQREHFQVKLTEWLKAALAPDSLD